MNAERWIERELARLNAHLPARRITLAEALRSERPHVVGRDGSIHEFDRGELELLANMLPEGEWNGLFLPILISFDPKLGRGTAKITGEMEVKVVGRLLGKKCAGEELLVYLPEITVLRKKLPTLTQYFFMV
jgi:uncharacterized protein (UPF0216 family)